MKVRFEHPNKKCEICGKEATWEFYEDANLDSYVAEKWEAHYYCDKCHAKKYED